VVWNERRQNYEDRPYGGIWLEIPAMMYPPEHPYHLNGIGSHEDLKAASLEHVKQFYSDWYRPKNATLVIAGDFEPEQTRKWVRKYFDPIPRGSKKKHLVPPEVKEPVTRKKTIRDNVQLPAMVMAWHSPSYFAEGDATLDTVSNLLTGGNDARLTRRLKIEEELVQNISAFQASSSRGSMFMVMAYAKPGADMDKIEAIINEEITALTRKKPATEKEISRSLRNWEMSFIEGLEGLMDRAETLQNYLLHTGKADYLDEDLNRYRQVTSEKISLVVKAHLAPEKSAVLHVLPKEEKKDEDKKDEGEQ
jgi:predicted Zn-dependent peptidase